jgi:hypothetical protein
MRHESCSSFDSLENKFPPPGITGSWVQKLKFKALPPGKLSCVKPDLVKSFPFDQNLPTESTTMRVFTALFTFTQVAVILAAPLPDGEFSFHALQNIGHFTAWRY